MDGTGSKYCRRGGDIRGVEHFQALLVGVLACFLWCTRKNNRYLLYGSLCFFSSIS